MDLTLYEESMHKLELAEPNPMKTATPNMIVYAIQALTLAVLAVGDEINHLSRSR